MTIVENGEDYILTDQIWGKVYTGENANFYSIKKGRIILTSLFFPTAHHHQLECS